MSLNGIIKMVSYTMQIVELFNEKYFSNISTLVDIVINEIVVFEYRKTHK